MDHHRLDGPFAWTRRRFEATDRWRFELSAPEIDDLEHAIETAQAAGCSARDIRREHFPLPILGAKLAAIADELENGCGVARVFGLPIERSRASAHQAIRNEISRLVTEAKQLPVLVIDEAHHLLFGAWVARRSAR